MRYESAAAGDTDRYVDAFDSYRLGRLCEAQRRPFPEVARGESKGSASHARIPSGKVKMSRTFI
jgi:hypothetical protein